MLPIKILPQPTDSTCGPTSLHAVYNYFNDNIPLAQVIEEVHYLKNGGTLAVWLGCHALKRGYETTVYNYNLRLFDPSWSDLSTEEIIEKLEKQIKIKRSIKLKEASRAYIEYLKLGGTLKFNDLTPELLADHFKKNVPILAGLSATYLYQCKRETVNAKDEIIYDDIKGSPTGHFVVLGGFDESQKNIVVADPYHANPLGVKGDYSINIQRLINSIMLGIVTYDANLLLIKPKK